MDSDVPTDSELPPPPPPRRSSQQNEEISYIETTLGRFKVLTIILGGIAAALGYTQFNFKSVGYQKKVTIVHKNKTNQVYNDGSSSKGTHKHVFPVFEPCCAIELETFFVYITIIVLTLSVLSLFINSLVELKSTYPDVVFHKVSGFMLFIAGFLFILCGVVNQNKDDHDECVCPLIWHKCKNTYQVVAGLFAFGNGILSFYLGCCCFNNSRSSRTRRSVRYSTVSNLAGSAVPVGTGESIPGMYPAQKNGGQFQPSGTPTALGDVQPPPV